jgi:hypothetical protein
MPPSFLPGTLRSRSKAGEDRRLRLVTDEVTRPGRFRPRVPPGALRPRCAGRCARWCGVALMLPARTKRNGRKQKSPAGRGVRAISLVQRHGTAPRFPDCRACRRAHSMARRFGGRGNGEAWAEERTIKLEHPAAGRARDRGPPVVRRPRGGQRAKRVYGRERKETRFLDSYRSGR